MTTSTSAPGFRLTVSPSAFTIVFSIAIKVVRTQYHDLSVFVFVGYPRFEDFFYGAGQSRARLFVDI